MPGQPGGDTWGGLAPEFRAGGDMWIPGVYDPVLDTFYIGTAQAKPWAAASRRMSSKDDALFTNSTLAIDRSEEHTSELQSLMRISYAVFCLKKNKEQSKHNANNSS